MTKIRERLYARCPFGRAPSYLSYYLDRLAKRAGGQESRVRLAFAPAALGLPGGLELGGDVEVHFAPLSDSKYGSHITAVDWLPVDGGPFPRFLGFIGIEADEEYGTCTLTIEGDYDPPMGIFGDAFDAAVGRKITKATARELLKDIRKVLEEE